MVGVVIRVKKINNILKFRTQNNFERNFPHARMAFEVKALRAIRPIL